MNIHAVFYRFMVRGDNTPPFVAFLIVCLGTCIVSLVTNLLK